MTDFATPRWLFAHAIWHSLLSVLAFGRTLQVSNKVHW